MIGLPSSKNSSVTSLSDCAAIYVCEEGRCEGVCEGRCVDVRVHVCEEGRCEGVCEGRCVDVRVCVKGGVWS